MRDITQGRSGQEDCPSFNSSLPDLNISVSNLLQSNATPEDMENHIDIADWLIRWKLRPETFENEKRNITFEKVKAFVSEEYQDEVLALIEDLDLIIF